MLDFGLVGGTNDLVRSVDCIPDATRIKVSWNGFMPGLSCDQYQGAVLPVEWSAL